MKTENQIIAEFMEMVPNPHDGKQTWSFPEDVHSVEGQIYGDWHRLQYDTSWDWLMPVVEKIESIVIGDLPVFVEITSGFVRIRTRNYSVTKSVTICGSKLSATHEAVVDFIEWYNKK